MSDRFLSPNERSLSQRVPLDLLAVVLITALAAGLLLVVRADFRAVRLVAGLLLVAFLPGYALTALLFPSTPSASTDTTWRALSWPRRYALSMVLSLILVPATALALDSVGFGYDWAQTTLSVAGLTVFLTVVAAVNRMRLPAEQRLSVPMGNWYAHIRRPISVDGWAGLALNIFLLLSAILAAGGVTHALTESPDESGTELYLLMENEQGELVADDYPQELPAGEPAEVVVGVERQGGTSSSEGYTLVILVQRVEGEGDDLAIVTQRQADRFRVDLGPDARFRQPTGFSLDTAGARYRVAFLLYEGEPPATPTLANAHREVHLLIDVQSNVSRLEPSVASHTRGSAFAPSSHRRHFSGELEAVESFVPVAGDRFGLASKSVSSRYTSTVRFAASVQPRCLARRPLYAPIESRSHP